ncbi:MAG TPA: permease-like cell division protein FtsX [Actinomycetota bacterium]
MRVEHYLRETASGIRRNGMVAFAAMSTAFIALFLFGLSLLIARQIDLLVEAITGNVEVTVYLTDPVKNETRVRLTETLQDLPAVESVEYESKEEAYERFLQLFAGQPTVIENADPDAIPASLRVKLADTSQYEQVPAALGCSIDDTTGETQCTAPGVREVHDYRDVIDKLNTLTNVLTWSVLGIALLMLGSAVALVANTLRMGMYARRTEIGIMRLVGATNWRIRAPFLIEGLVEALVGGLAAILVLFLGKVFFIDRLREQLLWLPLIRNSDVLWVAPFILLAAAGIAILAGTIGMRKFLDV